MLASSEKLRGQVCLPRSVQCHGNCFLDTYLQAANGVSPLLRESVKNTWTAYGKHSTKGMLAILHL